MTVKRKRNRHGSGNGGDSKRQRISDQMTSKDSVVKQAVLSQYYTQVVSLRRYLLSKLPPTSKLRRKKILSFDKRKQPDSIDDASFSRFLDQTVVGVRTCRDVSFQERSEKWISFSQRIDTSDSTFANLTGIGIYSQSEIVDFAIWLLFQKSRGTNARVQHLLCQGFRKDATSRAIGQDENVFCAIPGLVTIHQNSHVEAMKATPWTRVLAIMGKEGERVMIDLILDCGIFLPIQSARSSYHQLSGHPLGDLQTLNEVESQAIPSAVKSSLMFEKEVVLNKPAHITFVRNRMLYARAAVNAQGAVRFGLRHIHALNRFKVQSSKDPDHDQDGSRAKPQENTVRVMMYIFPRQFGLHNVFTSKVDPRETVQPLKDYTLREDEINGRFPAVSTLKIPKRLRGKTVELVQKMQALHSRCPYKKLLEYYCPIFTKEARYPDLSTPDAEHTASTTFQTQVPIKKPHSIDRALPSQAMTPPQRSMMDHATPTSMVGAFCRAVLSNLIPHDFLGTGEDWAHNQAILHHNISRFVELRRFESLSLHAVLQGIKLANMAWLGPPATAGQNMSQSDHNKRLEVLHEFMYYVFDSLLIPLIRANFHVTESNVHRYRIFFYRHDVWRTLTEPAIASLKLSMFEEIKLDRAQRILDSRTFGFSQIRLLPKQTGVRPIMNLRRRMMQKGYKNMLGSSINSALAPVYNAFTYEKVINPDRLGAALFSVGDLYKKLKSFKSTLRDTLQPLYFAKVDVKAAFDTIPQEAVVELMASLPTESAYRIAKHVEVKPGNGYLESKQESKPIRKWSALAKAPNDLQTFDENLETDLGLGRKNTIFVESIVNQVRDKDELVSLLAEHVQRNMVKIGKKFYRQKEGIPQGSVLSSLLCNYFYADLEARHLAFLQTGDSLLLRLIDDFLLITTEVLHAKQFLQIMHDGLPAYGVSISPDKTLVNFEATINGRKVPRLVGTRNFPYCGSLIDTSTLNITKDRERNKNTVVADSLTVEFSKVPGKSFHRKVLNSFKLQSHPMFLDTSHNSLPIVLHNLHSAFIETATKMWAYARFLPPRSHPSTTLLLKTVEDLVGLAFALIKGKGRKKGMEGYRCAVGRVQVEWLALIAFKKVLGKRQSRYQGLLAWIDQQIKRLRSRYWIACQRMEGIVKEKLIDD